MNGVGSTQATPARLIRALESLPELQALRASEVNGAELRVFPEQERVVVEFCET